MKEFYLIVENDKDDVGYRFVFNSLEEAQKCEVEYKSRGYISSISSSNEPQEGATNE